MPTTSTITTAALETPNLAALAPSCPPPRPLSLVPRAEASTDTSAWIEVADGVTVYGRAWDAPARDLLEPGLLAFLAELHREHETCRQALLKLRAGRQAEWLAGALPKYCDPLREATAGSWQVADVPADLRRRRVEITGPANDAKLVINMLSRNESGDRADTAMLDLEDSMKPTWRNVVDGLTNIRRAVAGDLEYVKPGANGQPARQYRLDPADMAKVMVRVRGLHLDESNLRVDGKPIGAGLFDFAVTLWHTAKEQVERGETPTFYVPKTEHFVEARWWNGLFVGGQQALGIRRGTLRATFLIETLPAAFQMEEILYELREHAAGLNVGRWDKIFSDIKVVMGHGDRVLADRASIGLNRPWMKAYALRLIQICHQRGAWAIGGMAAFTPGRTAELRQDQTSKVLADKHFEAELGHDGCWVSHPYFIGPALSAFKRDDQLDVRHEELDRFPDLLPQGGGPRTFEGLRTNVRVGIAYLEGWRRGLGCVAWDNLMEDLATLEISRAQVGQWLRHAAVLDDGRVVDADLVRQTFAEELARIQRELEEDGVAGLEAFKTSFAAAAQEAETIFLRETFAPFLASASELA
jgi:malate synthase